MVFLPRFFTFSSSSCLVFTTWSLKLHSGTKGPTSTKGPRGPKGTRGLRRMLWHDRNISKFVLNAIHFNQHGSYEFGCSICLGMTFFFFSGGNTDKTVNILSRLMPFMKMEHHADEWCWHFTVNWRLWAQLNKIMWTFSGGTARSAKGSCDVVVVGFLG